MILVMPEPQKHRSRSNCRCGGPCFYCGESLAGVAHDHDHLPIPWTFGGRETVPACKRCHRLKEGIPLRQWTPGALTAVAEGFTGTMVPGFVAMVHGALANDATDFDLRIDRDWSLRLLADCTTAEARIAVANLIKFVLGAQKRRDEAADSGCRMTVLDRVNAPKTPQTERCRT